MSVACSICRAEFPTEKGFRREGIGKGRYRRLCPGCCDRRAESASVFSLLSFVASFITGVLLIVFTKDLMIGRCFLFLGTFYLAFIGSIVIHELGHALAALAVGLRLFTIQIGQGGRLLSVQRFWKYDVAFYSDPLGGGRVVWSPKHLRGLRWRMFFMILAGPLTNAILIAIAAWLLAEIAIHDVSRTILYATIAENIMLLGCSVFPWMISSGHGQRIPNDGRQLLTTPFLSIKAREELHAATFFLELLEALERDQIDDAKGWLAKGIESYPVNKWIDFGNARILEHDGNYSAARDAYFAAINQPEITPHVRAAVANNIAWVNLLIADSKLLAEADQFSRQALEEIPWEPSIKRTRGSVLIELGQIEEGVRLVEQARWGNYSNANKALNACYLALAASRQGNAGQAKKYLDEVRRRDPKCVLLERVEKELSNPKISPSIAAPVVKDNPE